MTAPCRWWRFWAPRSGVVGGVLMGLLLSVALFGQVRALHGRDLCSCCAPAACHGDVLRRAAVYLSQA